MTPTRFDGRSVARITRHVAVAGVLATAVAGCDIQPPRGTLPTATPNTTDLNAAAPTPTPTPTGPSTTSSAGTRTPSPWTPGPSVLIGKSGTPAGGAPAPPSAVNGRDSVAVSRTVALIISTVDTAIDASGWDAQMRAAPYLAPDFLEIIRNNPPERGSGGEWLTWAEHQAYTTVEVKSADESGKPENTDTEAFHAWYVRTTAIGRDGWRGQPSDGIVYVGLTRTGPSADWKVSSLDFR